MFPHPPKKIRNRGGQGSISPTTPLIPSTNYSALGIGAGTWIADTQNPDHPGKEWPKRHIPSIKENPYICKTRTIRIKAK